MLEPLKEYLHGNEDLKKVRKEFIVEFKRFFDLDSDLEVKNRISKLILENDVDYLRQMIVTSSAV